MPPKKGLPAPIDRPLSRAYLREFKGWSSAFPPGVSDPTSLRVMENILITREGSARIRPGLRALARCDKNVRQLVGTHEPFYMNDGRKAYLVAMREGGRVVFRVATHASTSTVTTQPYNLTLFDLPTCGFNISAWGGDEPYFSGGTTYVKYVQIDNKILALSNNGEQLIVFHVGATKKVTRNGGISYPQADGASASAPSVFMPTYTWAASVNNEQNTQVPQPAQGFYPGTLISSDDAANIYNLGFFFTYSNELGESPASDVRLVKVSRGWGAWSTDGLLGLDGNYAAAPRPGWPAPNINQFGDMLILGVGDSPAAGFNTAISEGATQINFYMFAWSDQDNVPVEAGLIGTKAIGPNMVAQMDGFMRVTPVSTFQSMVPVPNAVNRYNSTAPSRAGQGLVASDRLVLVNDPTAAAVIRWTTNEQGNYLNFSPSRGGGYKTLTSGNMQVPACVKLWQNPQSADTITVLNMGTDGHSTSYYMAPAQVASQSDATNVMGFEETTATPGTVSPYGCEVANNTLYHPLADQLMKSTASNYNINHKSMTDAIANKWTKLVNKHKIVSCFHDQRLYFLVHNPEGVALEAHCNGNEVWVLDLAAEGGSWSRWLTQGVSLRKIELGGRTMLSLVRPDGIFAFDEAYRWDDRIGEFLVATTQNIPWRLETNTQGANRAHDAWAHLQQVALTVGNFQGYLRYGIRGKDIHGLDVDVSKQISQEAMFDPLAQLEPFDLEDQLSIRRDLKEWFFYASHAIGDDGLVPDGVLSSYGQLSLVQYRYTPVSVNVGYEFGSVETFEYGRDVVGDPSNTHNGIPQPYVDQGRP
jgi:hypothetical protein